MNKSKVIRFPHQLSLIKESSSSNLEVLMKLQSILSYQDKSVAVHTSKNIQIIPISTLLFIKSYSSYSTFHLACGKIIITSKTLKYWCTKIDDSHFLRCHNSYLINSKHVKTINLKEGYVEIKGNKIPISRSKRSEIITFFD